MLSSSGRFVYLKDIMRMKVRSVRRVSMCTHKIKSTLYYVIPTVCCVIDNKLFLMSSIFLKLIFHVFFVCVCDVVLGLA